MGTLTKSKSTGATSADSRQQPLKVDTRAASLAAQGKSTTGAADLQEKMMKAAKIIVAADGEDDGSYQRIDPITRLPNVNLYIFQYFDLLCCTPKDVFLLNQWERGEGWDLELSWEWTRLSPEYVAAAFKETFGRINDKLAARNLLRAIRKACKERGKVSWVLPKLPEGGLA